MPRTWTKEQEQFLRDNYGKMPYPEIAATLGLNVEQVKQKAGRMKITTSRAYPADHVAIVKELYPTTDTAQIAEKLGKPIHYVYGLAERHGIKKTEEYKAQVLQGLGKKLVKSGLGHRFKKGHVPANKGLRRPGWGPGRMKETQFKKGVRQGVATKLYKPIGSERLSKEGYRERKVNDDLPLQARWKAVHRIVWEEHNGPIPKGMKIAFRDGDKLNCSIENLELVSSADMMSRNTFHNYPEPVKQQIHVLAGFKRKLNNYAKKQDRRSS